MTDFSPWGPATVVGSLGGGHRNEVLELRRGGERLVARVTRRGPASLDWELDLLELLSANGFIVPHVIPADDGRRHVDGVVVQRRLPGHPPATYDWPAVAALLERLHELTTGWPQRPGFAATTDLLTANKGGDIDLTAMPPDAVTAIRTAWQALDATPHTVVHGDPSEANIRVTTQGIALLDWDEARVDHPDLDLADLPGPCLPGLRYRVARSAVDAWEAAAGWTLEPRYARRRLADLMARPLP